MEESCNFGVIKSKIRMQFLIQMSNLNIVETRTVDLDVNERE